MPILHHMCFSAPDIPSRPCVCLFFSMRGRFERHCSLSTPDAVRLQPHPLTNLAHRVHIVLQLLYEHHPTIILLLPAYGDNFLFTTKAGLEDEEECARDISTSLSQLPSPTIEMRPLNPALCKMHQTRTRMLGVWPTISMAEWSCKSW
jgi:hypothetical protein